MKTTKLKLKDNKYISKRGMYEKKVYVRHLKSEYQKESRTKFLSLSKEMTDEIKETVYEILDNAGGLSLLKSSKNVYIKPNGIDGKAAISHHYGIGKMFAPWLEGYLGKNEYGIIRTLKDYFDKDYMMNPGGTIGLDLPNSKKKFLKNK